MEVITKDVILPDRECQAKRIEDYLLKLKMMERSRKNGCKGIC